MKGAISKDAEIGGCLVEKTRNHGFPSRRARMNAEEEKEEGALQERFVIVRGRVPFNGLENSFHNT